MLESAAMSQHASGRSVICFPAPSNGPQRASFLFVFSINQLWNDQPAGKREMDANGAHMPMRPSNMAKLPSQTVATTEPPAVANGSSVYL
jgi:hypothetical protein